jgi:hypothetical protein
MVQGYRTGELTVLMDTAVFKQQTGLFAARIFDYKCNEKKHLRGAASYHPGTSTGPAIASFAKLPWIGDSLAGDNQFVIPGEANRCSLARVLVRVIRQQPNLAILRILTWVTGTQIVRTPVDNQLRRLAFPSNPQLNIAFDKFILYSRSRLDVYLKGHPFIREITKTTAFRRPCFGMRIEAGRTSVLQLEVCWAKVFLEPVVCSM